MRSTLVGVRAWTFDLTRHDTPAPTADPAPSATDPQPPQDPPADPPPADLAAELEKWKSLARKHETRSKENADKATKFDELEASQKTETEKLAQRVEEAEKRAVQLRDRAVKAEVKALAADFADPSDAALFLDLTKYAGEGDIDTDAIKTDLADLLKTKPHLAKARTPVPDLHQGARGSGDPANLRNADKVTLAAEAAKYGIKLRS